MKYPKLAAAIDDLLADAVEELGIEGMMALVFNGMPKPEPVEEKLPPIPVTKEEVLDAN